jgi:UDP-glucose 4-epimerase
MSNSVLVTGAAGFIGSHVAECCLRNGMTVVAVDDLSGGFVENIPRGASFVQGSVTDAEFVSRLFANNRFRYVYHLAAYAAEGLSHFIRRFNYQSNLIGSINLINESVKKDIECFVFTSSIAVYGANQTPMTEELPPQPEDPYGISKYAVELDLAAARRLFGLHYIIFRPHNVYGERQNIADRYRNVIGIFMNQVMQGQPMSIFGDGTQTRAFSHVDDVAPIIAQSPLMSSAYDHVFNIGADQPYSVLNLANVVADVFGIMPNIIHHPAREEVLHAFSSHEKVAKVFGSKGMVRLRDGIERMARWAKARGPTQPVVFTDIEVRKALPSSWNL